MACCKCIPRNRFKNDRYAKKLNLEDVEFSGDFPKSLLRGSISAFFYQTQLPCLHSAAKTMTSLHGDGGGVGTAVWS